MAGIDNSSEITTCSLHTSLAAKMQVFAQSNEIIIGQNIKSRAGLKDEFFNIIDEESRYIYKIPEINFFYTQYKFDWFKFLKSLEYIAVSMNGNLDFRIAPSIISNIIPLKEIASPNKPWGV
jgi:hypothetical protein